MPIPSPRKGEKQDDFISRCHSALADDHPDQDERNAICFTSWRKKHGGTKPQSKHKDDKKVKHNMITLQAEAGKARKKKFNGIEHVVVPVIALVEGVLQSANADSPELALASEFGKAPLGWNGRPVTVNHPEIRGEKVSANSPDVLETEQIGQLFNTTLSDKKLKTEAWINTDRVNELGGEIQVTVQRLLDGDIVEVSTGLFSDVEPESGVHDGEKFSGVWRNVVPDHLAILTEGTIGACSIADGCGANRANCACKGNCVMNNSKEKGGKPLASNSNSGDNPTDGEEGNLSVFEKIKSFVGIRANKELSHNTILRAIEGALEAEEGFAWVVDVFKNHFIVQKEGGLFRRSFTITEGGKVKLGSETVAVRPEIDFVELKTNEEDVMDKDKFVTELIANEASQFEKDDAEWLGELEDDQLEKLKPLEAKKKDDAGSKGADAGSGNAFNVCVNGEAKNFDPTTLQEEIKKNGPMVFGEVKTKVEPKTNEKKDEPKTAEEYIAAAPPALQEVLSSGLRAHTSRRSELVTQIKANSKNKFTDEALTAMNLESLENLATLAVPDDYSGRSVPRTNEADDPNAVPLPPQVFDLSAANGKAKE